MNGTNNESSHVYEYITRSRVGVVFCLGWSKLVERVRRGGGGGDDDTIGPRNAWCVVLFLRYSFFLCLACSVFCLCYALHIVITKRLHAVDKCCRYADTVFFDAHAFAK